MSADSNDYTDLTLALRSLNDPESGGQTRDQAVAFIYDELRRIAGSVVKRRGRAQDLEPTQLVHDLYLKLADAESLNIESRRHFFTLAATAMQQIVIDDHRHQQAEKRGGGRHRVDFSKIGSIAIQGTAVDVLDVATGLAALHEADSRAALVVRLRFFCGLTLPEIAETIQLSVPTVEREWRSARAWLGRHLGIARKEPEDRSPKG